MDLQMVVRHLLGTNVIPPIPADARILDVGAGCAGAWCIEVAHQFPNAFIAGLDISRIERPDKPANCSWIRADLNKGLPFEDASLDFVASRFTIH
jgi:ubiquinone/menaquinone biosynthesis C-methylase UbiE